MPEKHTGHHKAKHNVKFNKAEHTLHYGKVKHVSHKEKPKKEPIIPAIIALVAIIVIVAVIINIDKILPKQSSIVALVNGEKISADDIDWRYNLVVQSQPDITKEIILNSTIDEIILVQEAKKESITIKDSDVDAAIDYVLTQLGMTAKQFEEARKIKIDQLKSLYKNKMIIDSLITAKAAEILVLASEQEIKEFYAKNKENIALNFSDVKDQIQQLLGTQKYVEILRLKSTVELFISNLGNAAGLSSLGEISTGTGVAGSTFTDTSEPICKTADGKPIIRLFSTTWCPHCKWVKSTFDKVAKEYVDAGKIAAYHWELDVGDNTLTAAKETDVPAEEEAIFSKYNPQGGVPTYVLGCKYMRVGNGYEAQSDLKAEEAEFRKMIDSLIAG